jgi:hypothetical protein
MKQKNQLLFFVVSGGSGWAFSSEIHRPPKLAQQDKVLHRWFTAIHSKEKPTTGHIII